ncbi:MAG: metal-dependent hydrolase [Deltaproteobacteria bacterium HGW-Deltaproteobacteria-19]|nr:MAG: metal-dependent hydrolase [Deltaproteobacteria bacterium HGW-Deltaproteobacteria-19]
MKIIDSHMHCGIRNVNQPYGLIRSELDDGAIAGACLFAPVEDVYDRYDYHFEDSQAWVDCRQRANRYLLDVQKEHEDFFAYYFVWNDFRHEELGKGYRGVKWHRHEYEPVYRYGDPRCGEFLQEVFRLELPVVLEESYENTMYFLSRVAGRTVVIIPHMGMLNGGFSALFREGIWEDRTVYADTALASRQEIVKFLDRYGPDRLLFGSDFPFGTPCQELQKIERLGLPAEDIRKIVSTNILKLMKVEL